MILHECIFQCLQVIGEYKEVGIKVFLAGCKAGVREMLEAAKFYDKIDKDTLFIRVHDAVLTALERDPDLLHVVSIVSYTCKYMLFCLLGIVKTMGIQVAALGF